MISCNSQRRHGLCVSVSMKWKYLQCSLASGKHNCNNHIILKAVSLEHQPSSKWTCKCNLSSSLRKTTCINCLNFQLITGSHLNHSSTILSQTKFDNQVKSYIVCIFTCQSCSLDNAYGVGNYIVHPSTYYMKQDQV
jgi:hypothetical protein